MRELNDRDDEIENLKLDLNEARECLRQAIQAIRSIQDGDWPFYESREPMLKKWSQAAKV